MGHVEASAVNDNDSIIINSNDNLTGTNVNSNYLSVNKLGNDLIFAHINCASVLKNIDQICDIINIFKLYILSLNVLGPLCYKLITIVNCYLETGLTCFVYCPKALYLFIFIVWLPL